MRTRKFQFTMATRILLKLLSALFVLAVCAAGAGAQTYRGSIHGVVTDPTGAVIVDATVTVRNSANGDSRTVTTTNDGGYVIPELLAGEYAVEANSTGFMTYHRNAVVEVGLDTAVDIRLEVAGFEGTRTVVTAAAPLVDTERDVLGEVVDNRMVEELPLNGRDFGKLVALVPGVTVEGSGVAGTEKGFGQFNINGNRDRSNNYTLDGTDNNDPWFNNSGFKSSGHQRRTRDAASN